MVSAYLPDHWTNLCEALGRPDLPGDPRFLTNLDRVKNRATLLPQLQECFAKRTAGEWVQDLVALGLLVGQVRGYDQILDELIETESPLLLAIETAGPNFRTLNSPTRRQPGRVRPTGQLQRSVNTPKKLCAKSVTTQPKSLSC